MAAKVSSRNIVNKTGGVQTEDGRLLYGMDADLYLKVSSSLLLLLSLCSRIIQPKSRSADYSSPFFRQASLLD